MRWCLIFFAVAPFTQAGESVSFKAKDGLWVTADVSRIAEDKAPFMILCHQAGWSRGEYRETTSWLNEMGFHVLALDQRSGKAVNGVVNKTAERAKAKGLSMGYLDAKQDIEAAIGYVNENYQPAKLVLLGSSYSASLVLRIAGEGHHSLKAVLAFSPGEYFREKPDYVREKAANIDCLVFITSAAKEKDQWVAIANAIPKNHLNAFVPGEKGEHGSRALWQGKSGWRLYRHATQAFLARVLEK